MINENNLKYILSLYFRKINDIADEDILKYYLTFKEYVDSDPTIEWFEIGSNYLVKPAFVCVCPCDILEAIEKSIQYLNKDLTENTAENIKEFAVDITSNFVDEVFYKKGINPYKEINGEYYYTDEASDLFSNIKDQIYDFLIN